VRTVTASVVVQGPAVEAEQLWYDDSRWASWIDGFGHVVRLDDHWPQESARRVWDARGGLGRDSRGRVSETVTAYRAGEGQTLALEDARVRGVQRVRFESDGSVTRIAVELDLEPKERLAPARRWWLRRQFGDALKLSLRRFSYELAAERER
jgi:hypothetical protein